jgi:hypothetical protein
VEKHVVGAVILEGVAVDAMPILLAVNHPVVVDVALIIAGEVTLNDGEILVSYV